MGSVHTEKLNTLLRTSTNSNEPEFKIALTRLSAELAERQKSPSRNSPDIFNAALSSLSRLKGAAHSELRISCLCNCYHFFAMRSDGPQALEAARQLEILADRTQNQFALRRAANFQGIIYGETGNISEAIISYGRGLEIASQMADLEAEAYMLSNLGVALNYAGLYGEAIPALQKAAAIGKTLGHSAAEAAALSNLSQSFMYLDDFSRGLATIERCLAISEPPIATDTAISRTIREFTFVQLALGIGELATARLHRDECHKYSQMAGNKRTKILATIAAALCEVRGGDVTKGLAMLEETLSDGDDFTSLRRDSLIALVKANDEAGRPDVALRYLRQLMLEIKKSRDDSLAVLFSLNRNNAVEFTQPSPDGRPGVLAQKEMELRARVAEQEVFNTRVEMLERLAVTADLKEEASGEHGYRVGKLSSLLAERMKWSSEACGAIELAARLHDIGKMSIPDHILLSSEQLKQAERDFIGTHTRIGAELLGQSNIPQLRMAEDIARCHHEWWDGSGYPAKLAGKRIPIHARAVALADVFDALTHGRPYAEPWSYDRAIEEIQRRRATQFDPDLTDVFLELIACLRAEHLNLDEFLGKSARNSPFLQARNRIRSIVAKEHKNDPEPPVPGNETRH